MWIDARVIASAVITALLTTLAVEYFAKPWLEARKERILEEHRRRRELQRDLSGLAVSRGVIGGIGAIWDTAPARIVEEIERFRATVARTQESLPLLHNWRVPSYILSWLSRGIGRLDGSLFVLSALVSTQASSPERDAAISSVIEAHESLIPAADYVILKGRAHRQPFISRRRTMWAARRAIKKGEPGAYRPLQQDESW